MNDAAPDQSMEDVLASIKRVMARDPVPDTAPRRRQTPLPDDVLELRPEDQDTESLSSPATIQASRQKLQSLAGLDASQSSGAVESWAAELMKPMLRAWLDEHLPAMVEAAVEREVRRITRG